MRHRFAVPVLIAVLLSVTSAETTAPSALTFITYDSANLLKQADVVGKVKVTSLKRTKDGGAIGPNGEGGAEFEAVCHLLAPIKGDPGEDFKISFQESFRLTNPLEEGKVYIVYLHGKESLMLGTAMHAEEAPAELQFGKEPEERLLVELIAKANDKDPQMRGEGITELGMLRDPRGAKAVKPAQNDTKEEIVRAAVMALYRMKTAPDAKKVMAVFNPEVMDVWYEESGKQQVDAEGHPIMRREHGMPFFERGLPDFDYAAYVREGIKHDWVRKDYDTLYRFFGVPWKVQRRECVPELVKLLDDPDVEVRGFAVLCLNHTVNDKDEPQIEAFKRAEETYLTQWKTWWKEQGAQYMAMKPGAQ